ncbi:Hypothetical predicted protein [Lecanosticta acicola]|uniref:ubiquitinyl hydrolase 1 n=1 Tax=Lecanosticta acicola TaxID=111012 RepID=A0AAI8YW63_9PEZI|nr:Hypothetical predicted protein [Lecanosticta acicola]
MPLILARCCSKHDNHSRLSADDDDIMLHHECVPLLPMAEKKRKGSSVRDVAHFLYGSACKSLRRTKSDIHCFDKVSKSNTPAHRPDHFGGIFAIEDDPKTKPDKEEERRIQGVLERLRAYGINTMVESNARYALRVSSSQGDGEAAFRLLMLLQETYEGIVRPYNPETKLLGAINREMVTCYLDALLFAMFARLDSFEAMLYDSFDDKPRKRLAGLLRLWVNLLRTGRLITTDVTRHLQEALTECGWEDAVRLKQQDPSEAFTFITGQLELPLLTLKMDLHHAGKEDPQDDHKFINERLLEVAILEEPPEGSDVITLEDCLEHYFNNRIEVKRHMENQRRNTLKSASMDSPNTPTSPTKMEKESGIHVEVAEVPQQSTSGTPTVQTPVAETATQSTQTKDPFARVRPIYGRKRGDSIFSQRKVILEGVDPDQKVDPEAQIPDRERKLSTRTEVLMPAWQFFKLLPWYTDHMPMSDAQVAAHFSKKRPVLGICLKRYSYTNTGQASRLNTYIDIPTEMTVPNFVSDEDMQEEGPLVGNFRLLLQSVVCHRGVSVQSGHYVTLTRGTAANATQSRRGSDDSDDIHDPWMRFDDLAKDRVTYVDIRESLKQETPYLLFYQVQPIGDDGHSIHDLPSYAEATSRAHSDATPLEKPYLNDPFGSDYTLEQVPSQPLSDGRTGSESTDWAVSASGRNSLEVNRALESARGRRSLQGDDRRLSIPFDAASVSGGSARTDATVSIPSTPKEEKDPDRTATGLLAVANKLPGSRRGSRAKNGSQLKSRPTSTGPDTNSSRFSLNMSRLTQKMSRSDESKNSAPASTQAETPPDLPATASVTEITDEKLAQTDSGTGEKPTIAMQVQHLISDTASDDTAKPSQGTLKPPGKAATTAGNMTKKEKAAMKQEKRRARKGEDDRECTLM